MTFSRNMIGMTFGVAVLFCTLHDVNAQDSLASKNRPLTVSGYLETYYVFDFNKPKDNMLPGFLYSFNRHNEVNVNLAFIKVAYTEERARANFALMTGTYANANLDAEPGVLQNIFEANAGIKLSKEKDLWIDAGVFSSHIGFESAIGADTWTLTRSILAENSPYFEAGAKLSYTTSNGRWFLCGLLLNGWQRIQRIDGNSLPSFGTQVKFAPSDKIVINSSTFIGTDSPDQSRQMRYFHNFFANVQLLEKTSLIVGFDIGMQQAYKRASRFDTWYSPVIIVRQELTKRNALAVRGEYYEDMKGVIIESDDSNAFRTAGLSLNYDHNLVPNAMWRVEARIFHSRDAIFSKDDKLTPSIFLLATSVAISF